MPYMLVLTKADKIPSSKLKKQIEIYEEQFQTQIADGCCHGIVPFSIVNGDGRIELLKRIETHLTTTPSKRKAAV